MTSLLWAFCFTGHPQPDPKLGVQFLAVLVQCSDTWLGHFSVAVVLVW